MVIWYIFHVLVFCTKQNLATMFEMVFGHKNDVWTQGITDCLTLAFKEKLKDTFPKKTTFGIKSPKTKKP
jgi:hypothetical protein